MQKGLLSPKLLFLQFRVQQRLEDESTNFEYVSDNPVIERIVESLVLGES